MKIDPDKLRVIADELYDNEVVSATQLGKIAGMNKDTLWQNMRNRGMSKAALRKLVAAIDSEATRLRNLARSIRDVINDS